MFDGSVQPVFIALRTFRQACRDIAASHPELIPPKCDAEIDSASPKTSAKPVQVLALYVDRLALSGPPTGKK